MGDELVDFGYAHVFWVSFVVVEDVFTDPVGVGFFGAGGVLFYADLVAVLVEEFFAFLGVVCVARCIFHILAPF